MVSTKQKARPSLPLDRAKHTKCTGKDASETRGGQMPSAIIARLAADFSTVRPKGACRPA